MPFYHLQYTPGFVDCKAENSFLMDLLYLQNPFAAISNNSLSSPP